MNKALIQILGGRGGKWIPLRSKLDDCKNLTDCDSAFAGFNGEPKFYVQYSSGGMTMVCASIDGESRNIIPWTPVLIPGYFV
ncbi:MAG: hypothetical protein CM1200mP3_15000 [Chloroflexota bacterium]|nr:MAG: hypothetical protein CM1200mP3_15000 [Chloroflexota bacterium]